MRLTPDKSATKGDRILAVVAACVLLGSVGFIGRTYFVQRQRSQQALLTSQERTVTDIDKANQAARSTSPQEAAKLEKANLLRAKWSQWAMKNKESLQHLLRAQPDDKEAINRVWKKLPRPGDKANVITATDLLPKGKVSTDVDFGWTPAGDLVTDQFLQQVSDPQQRAVMSSSRQQFGELRDEEFVKFRDVALATSLEGGNTTVTLWVSGRITTRKPQTQEERTQAIADAKSRGKNPSRLDLQGEQHEVAPPYDFLR